MVSPRSPEATSNSSQAPSSTGKEVPRVQLSFTDAVSDIRSFEYSRRLTEMDPENADNHLAYVEAKAKVNQIWVQYQGGGLDEYTNQLFDLFLALWFWDAGLPGRSVCKPEPSSASPTPPSPATSKPSSSPSPAPTSKPSPQCQTEASRMRKAQRPTATVSAF